MYALIYYKNLFILSSHSKVAENALIHLPVILGVYSYLPVTNDTRMSRREI